MNDDRFEDLGAEPPRRGARAVGDRLADRDRTHPEPVKRPEVPRPGNKYAWAVGIVAVMVLSVLLFVQTLPNQGEGLEGPREGRRIPAFAAPSAVGNKTGEANVCQRADECNDQNGVRPACQVRGQGIVNVCELWRRPLVLTFVFDRGADCLPQVDRTERLADALPDVQFATVFFTRKDAEEVERIVSGRGWQQPVAVDGDGAVATLYGVGGCPTTVFARAGGRAAATRLGNLTEAQLRRQAERLTG